MLDFLKKLFSFGNPAYIPKVGDRIRVFSKKTGEVLNFGEVAAIFTDDDEHEHTGIERRLIKPRGWIWHMAGVFHCFCSFRTGSSPN